MGLHGLDPVEGLWSCLKAVELANLGGPTLAAVIDQAHRGIDRGRRTPHLASSSLRHTGLSVAWWRRPRTKLTSLVACQSVDRC